MNTKPPECWAGDSNARAVQIELSVDRSLLLPLDDLLFAETTTTGNEQCLRAVFGTHEVLVHGSRLRRVETALQRAELSHLVSVPARYEKLIAEGQPIVRSITVTARQPTEVPLGKSPGILLPTDQAG